MYEPELLAPAGCYPSLQAAIDAGADAVYFGLSQLNMRARARRSFDLDDLPEITQRCQAAGVKTNLTLNTLLYDHDLKLTRKIMEEAKRCNVSAVIVADMAAVQIANELGLETHISTQLSISNYESFKFYSQFSDRIVLARELTLKNIDYLHQQIVKEMVRLTGIKKPVCRRNLLVRMEYLTFEDQDKEGQQLKGLVEKIISAGVRPNDICVLSALCKDDSCIQRNKSLLGITVTYLEKGFPATVAPGSVLAASVSGFKGLEAEVIILTDMPELSASSSEWERSMWYVGMTRCTTKLFAIVRKEFLEKRFAD